MKPNRPPSTGLTLLPLPRRSRRNLVTCAVVQGLLAGVTAGVLAGAATPAHAQAAPAVQSYAIPPGPLTAALARLGRDAGVMLSYSTELTAGLQTRGLEGRYTVPEALRVLLADTGLEAAALPNGGYVLRNKQAAPVAQAASAALRETVLPALKVVAAPVVETATGPSGGYVARRSVTATKTDLPMLRVPQSISVVTSDEMDDKGVATLTDALAQTAGVALSPYGFDSRAADWVTLRGFDGWYTSSYRDGLIQNVGLVFLGVQTEVYGLERIEVVRGPASVLFGKGDVGGVVNRISKLPSAQAVREVAVQLGSFGRKQLAADLGGALGAGDAWQYRVVGVGLDTETQDRYPNGVRMDQKRRYLAPSLSWKPAPQTLLTLQAEYLRDDSADDVQYVSDAKGQPTDVKEGEPGYSRIKPGTDAVGYQFEHRFDSGWSLSHKLRVARRTMDKHHMLSWLDDSGTTLERQARHDVEAVRETTVDTSLRGTARSGPIEHAWLVGIDLDRSRADWRRWQDMTSPLDLAHPVYGVPVAEPATAVADTRFTSTQTGLYVQDHLTLGPRWDLLLGLRHDRVESETDDRFNAALASQTDNATTGRVGVNYRIGGDWTSYASWSESFVPNVGSDAAGAAFAPSRGKQYEAGVKFIPEDGSASFTAAVFDLTKTAVVSYDPQTFEPRQIGRVRARGLELEARQALTRQLRLIASFAALDMEVLASADPAEVGRMPILTPKQTATAWLDWTVASEVSVSAGLRHLGRRWNDVANTSSEPAYTLLDAAVRYETGPWRLALNVNNLLDRRYYSGRAYGSHFRGADRNAVVTAKYRF